MHEETWAPPLSFLRSTDLRFLDCRLAVTYFSTWPFYTTRLCCCCLFSHHVYVREMALEERGCCGIGTFMAPRDLSPTRGRADNDFSAANRRVHGAASFPLLEQRTYTPRQAVGVSPDVLMRFPFLST